MKIETIKQEAASYFADHAPERLKKLRTQMMPIILSAGKLNLFKKLLSGSESNKLDYILLSVIAKVATENTSALKETVEVVINEAIGELATDSHTISKDKEKSEDESYSTEEQLEAIYPSMSDRSFVDQASPGKLSQPSNPTIAPPSPESRKNNMAAAYGHETFKALESCFKNAEKSFGRKLEGDLDWRNILKKAFRKDVAKYLTEIYRQRKSVYSLGQENGIKDYRRLLYTLRTINFPMSKAKEREGQIITANWLLLFNTILPKIKQIWKQKDNMSDWIAYLKKKGWKKARISLFMSRSIKRNILPPCFFELTSPGNPLERSALDNPAKFMKMVATSEGRTAVLDRANSYRRKLTAIKELCINSQKSILSEGADTFRP